MPGRSQDGSLDLQDGYGYCDAKSGRNVEFCPEMDLMEANQKGFATTAHSCEKAGGSAHYTKCDSKG